MQHLRHAIMYDRIESIQRAIFRKLQVYSRSLAVTKCALEKSTMSAYGCLGFYFFSIIKYFYLFEISLNFKQCHSSFLAFTAAQPVNLFPNKFE